MFVTARFEKSQSRQLLTLPPEAVVTEGVQTLVFCPDKSGYRKVPVEIGLRQSDWVEISKGLNRGQVVVRRAQSLLEGLRQ
jgi:multidrug efflux pump subunit AcrA (membrane-fusion protein)